MEGNSAANTAGNARRSSAAPGSLLRSVRRQLPSAWWLRRLGLWGRGAAQDRTPGTAIWLGLGHVFIPGQARGGESIHMGTGAPAGEDRA